MNTYILGAGASKAFDTSPTKERMPLAKEVFATFDRLDVSANPWVLIGNIINYARDKKKIPIMEVFRRNYDIEAFHSEVESDLIAALEKSRTEPQGQSHLDAIAAHAVFTQLMFFFACVLNEIQNGPVSTPHSLFAQNLEKGDTIITFNWDTLMDRALFEKRQWTPETGYGFRPLELFNDGWIPAAKDAPQSEIELLKLHGSTNWLSSYLNIGENQKLDLIQEGPRDTVRVYIKSTKPYPTYAGRYMSGYAPFSMGYYPPNIDSDPGKAAGEDRVFIRTRIKHALMPESNLPDDGLPSMPLIIPPVKNKSYDLYGDLFGKLWTKAEQAITDAESIYLIGYSFPVTDIRSVNLFKKALCKRKTIPRVVIVNPNPERIVELLTYEFGIPLELIIVKKAYFDGANHAS